MNISSLCEPGLKRAGKAAFKKLHPELQQIVLDNLDSISFGPKDQFYDHHGKYKIVIHEIAFWFLSPEARFGRMALVFTEILHAIHPPSDRKEWELSGEYWRETLPEVEFYLLCSRLLENGKNVDTVRRLTMDEVPDEIKLSPIH